MQLSKKIPFDDPNVLNGVRALYVFSNVLILGIYLYVQQQINKKRGMLMAFASFQASAQCYTKRRIWSTEVKANIFSLKI